MPLSYFLWISVNFDFPARVDFMLAVYVRERFCVCVPKKKKKKIKRGSTTQKAQKRFCTNSHVSHFLILLRSNKFNRYYLKKNNYTINSTEKTNKLTAIFSYDLNIRKQTLFLRL